MYDEKLKRLTTIKVPGNHARKILFDSDGNINIGGWSPNIYVYDPDSYNLIKTITHKGAHYIDGFVINCDGSRVIADQLGGQVIFANRVVSRATPPFSYAKYGLVTLVQRSLHTLDLRCDQSYCR